MNVLKGDRSIPIPIRTQCQRIVDHAGRLRGYVRRNSVYFTILSNSYGSQIENLSPHWSVVDTEKVWQGNIQLSIPIHHLVCPFDTSLFPFHLVISQCTCTCQLIAAAQSHVDDVLFRANICVCFLFFCSRFGLFLQHV